MQRRAGEFEHDGQTTAGGVVVLLPQAAISRVVTAAAAVPINAVCLTVILHWTRLCRCPGVTELPPKPRLPED